jgi:hypothetical protein
MPNPHQATATPPSVRTPETEAGPTEFPVREYIGAMALELAQMARFDGDEPLAVMLGAAADRAATGSGRPHPVVREAEPSIKRPS